MDSLRWLGLDWDEGPYFQSQRLDIYREVARPASERGASLPVLLLSSAPGRDAPGASQKEQPPGYDRNCRQLTQKQKAEMVASGSRQWFRFKSPLKPDFLS